MWSSSVFTLRIYESEYRKIERYVLGYENIETGGDLFGLWSANGEPVIQLIIGPGEKCRRTSVSFHQDTDYLDKVGNYVNTSFMLCHIGSWHSHHQLSLNQPSAGDRSSVCNNFPSGLQRYIMIIANIVNRTRQVVINPYMFSAEGRVCEAGSVEVIESRSPFREYSCVLKMISEGAEEGSVGRSTTNYSPTLDHSQAENAGEQWYLSVSGRAKLKEIHEGILRIIDRNELDSHNDCSSNVEFSRNSNSGNLSLTFSHDNRNWSIEFPRFFEENSAMISYYSQNYSNSSRIAHTRSKGVIWSIHSACGCIKCKQALRNQEVIGVNERNGRINEKRMTRFERNEELPGNYRKVYESDEDDMITSDTERDERNVNGILREKGEERAPEEKVFKNMNYEDQASTNNDRDNEQAFASSQENPTQSNDYPAYILKETSVNSSEDCNETQPSEDPSESQLQNVPEDLSWDYNQTIQSNETASENEEDLAWRDQRISSENKDSRDQPQFQSSIAASITSSTNQHYVLEDSTNDENQIPLNALQFLTDDESGDDGIVNELIKEASFTNPVNQQYVNSNKDGYQNTQENSNSLPSHLYLQQYTSDCSSDEDKQTSLANEPPSTTIPLNQSYLPENSIPNNDEIPFANTALQNGLLSQLPHVPTDFTENYNQPQHSRMSSMASGSQWYVTDEGRQNVKKLHEQIVSNLVIPDVEFSRLTRSGELIMTFLHDKRKWTLMFLDEEHAEIKCSVANNQVTSCVAFVENIVSVVQKLCQCRICEEHAAKQEIPMAHGTKTERDSTFTPKRPIVPNRRYRSDTGERQDNSDIVILPEIQTGFPGTPDRSPVITSQPYQTSSSEKLSVNLHQHGNCEERGPYSPILRGNRRAFFITSPSSQNSSCKQHKTGSTPKKLDFDSLSLPENESDTSFTSKTTLMPITLNRRYQTSKKLAGPDIPTVAENQQELLRTSDQSPIPTPQPYQTSSPEKSSDSSSSSPFKERSQRRTSPRQQTPYQRRKKRASKESAHDQSPSNKQASKQANEIITEISQLVESGNYHKEKYVPGTSFSFLFSHGGLEWFIEFRKLFPQVPAKLFKKDKDCKSFCVDVYPTNALETFKEQCCCRKCSRSPKSKGKKPYSNVPRTFSRD